MEVTDLMVGDWVYISGKPVKITKGKLAMLLFLDGNPEISPIPLNVAGIPIHYVHQLQHLLRLCGIEKEITL